MANKVMVTVMAGIMLAGCSNMTHRQQRELSGGAIGAAAGAAVTGLAGGPLLLGGAIGAAGGALIGGASK